MRRLPLGPIEAFVVVAKSQSLAQAALTMNLTVPALSRRIRLLETHLGVALFRRLPRGLVLTQAGVAYKAALLPAWEQVNEATEAARGRRPQRTVKVSVMPTFAANWLMPRLGRFHARHADLDVAVETSADLVDFEARPDLHCAIRLGKGPWPGLASEPLLAVDAFPVATPDFFAAPPAPRCARDLLDHLLIETNHQPAFWREWFAAMGIDPSAGQFRSFDNLQVVYEAAAAGMGIALGLDPVVRPYLESGRLARLLPTSVRLPRHFQLVWRQTEKISQRPLAQFRDWLNFEARAFAQDAVASPARPLRRGVAFS